MISFGTLPAARASDVFSPKGNKANAEGGREVSFTFVSPETPGTSLCRRSVSAADFSRLALSVVRLRRRDSGRSAPSGGGFVSSVIVRF